MQVMTTTLYTRAKYPISARVMNSRIIYEKERVLALRILSVVNYRLYRTNQEERLDKFVKTYFNENAKQLL